MSGVESKLNNSYHINDRKKQNMLIDNDPFSCNFYKIRLKECLENDKIMPKENKLYCNAIIKMFNPNMCQF